MVIGSGEGYMVGCFLGEDLGEVGIFRRERDFGFRLFGGNGELRCHSEFGDEWGGWEEAFAIAAKDSVDLAIVQRMLEILVLHIMVEVVIDGVYVDMVAGARKGFSKERVVSLGISGMGRVKIL